MYSYHLTASILLLLSALSHADTTETTTVTKYAVPVGTGGSFSVSDNSTTTSSAPSAQTTLSLFNACAASSDNSSSSSSSSCVDSGITFYGAIITADPTATVFAINCAGSLNSTTCNSHTITLTQGPSMFARVRTIGGDDDSNSSDGTSDSGATIASLSCAITSSTQGAVCVQVDSPASATSAGATGSGAADFVTNSANGTGAAATTATVSFGSAEIDYSTLIITAGVEKLASATPTKTPIAPSSPTNVGTTPTKKPSAASSSKGMVGASLAGVVALLFAVCVL